MVNKEYGERIEDAMKQLEDKSNLYLTHDGLKTYVLSVKNIVQYTKGRS